MNEKEWHEFRAKGIGGSDCAAILGLSPYMTNVELWEDKALGKKKEFKANKEFLERGHKVEPLIRSLFEIDHPELDVDYYEYDMFASGMHDFIRCTIDGRLTAKKKGVLEIKHVQIENSIQREKWKNNKIPDNYFCQILHNLVCTNYDFAILKVRFRNKYEESIYITENEYHFDTCDFQEEISYLVEKEIEFWNKYVIPKVKPALILPKI